MITLLVMVFAPLIVHECGHLAAAVALGMPVSSMKIGTGPLVASFCFRGVWARLHLLPIGGRVVTCWRSRRRWKNIAVYAAGPAANLAFAMLVLPWSSMMSLASALLALNLLPFSEAGQPSDGEQILRELRAR